MLVSTLGGLVYGGCRFGGSFGLTGGLCMPRKSHLVLGFSNSRVTPWQGWRQGRTRGGYSPLSEHASPPSEGEKLFCRRFLAFKIP